MVTRLDRAVSNVLGVLLRPWRWLKRRLGLGHRAAFLVGFGIVYVALGFNVVPANAHPDPYLFHTQLPTELRVGIWGVTGWLAILASRETWQWVGFAALSPAPLERFVSYVIAVLETANPGDPPPYLYLNGVVIYALVLFVVALINGWPDPPTDPPLKTRTVPSWIMRLSDGVRPVLRRPWLAPRTGGYQAKPGPKGPPPAGPGAASKGRQ